MSSTKTLLTTLGVSTTSCFHGHPVVRGNEYPNNATATFILQQVVINIEKPKPIPKEVMKHMNELFHDPLSRARLDANLMKSLVMIGTDLMRFCTGEADRKLMMASELAVAILVLEGHLEFCATEAGRQGEIKTIDITECPRMMKALCKLDCPRGLVLFYDMRNPCSCLDQAKELHKELMGRCNYHACLTYCSDAKLLTCKRCLMQKYCRKACQKADWSEHKRACKIVEKHNKSE